jgi:hypothetical protein
MGGLFWLSRVLYWQQCPGNWLLNITRNMSFQCAFPEDCFRSPESTHSTALWCCFVFSTLQFGNEEHCFSSGLNHLSYRLYWHSHDSSVGIALGYGLDDRGSRVRFLEGGLEIFLITASRKALGPTQPPIQWAPGALLLRVKRPGREADHSHPSTAVVKEWVELYLHSRNTPPWSGAQLKHRVTLSQECSAGLRVGWSGVRVWGGGLEFFLFTTATRTALGPTQPPIQWVPEAHSLGVKRPGREADHSPPSSAENKECRELYLHSPIRLHGLMLS